MKKPILIIQHCQREGLGLMADVISATGWPSELVFMHPDTTLPQVERYAAMIVLGGPPSALDPTPMMDSVHQATRIALREHIPYFGVCLGMQILAHVQGATVYTLPEPETGLRTPHGSLYQVNKNTLGKQDPIFHGVKQHFPVFQLHHDAVAPHPAIAVLADDPVGNVQMIKVGPTAYGTQFHLEVTRDMLTCWLQEDPDLSKLNAASVQADFELIFEDYTKAGLRLFSNFLSSLDRHIH